MPTIKIKKGNERKIGAWMLLFTLVVLAITGATENTIFTTIGIVVGIVFGILGLYFFSGAPFFGTYTRKS